MLLSLGQILFLETVKQIVFGEGLPFGAITAGLQFDQISYLWSKEFLATCCATFKTKISYYYSNRIITMPDGFRFVARILYPITEPKFLVVASEVATLEFLRSYGILVLKVFGYSAITDNSMGTEYIS